jgi:hypothetical protein
MMMWFHGQCTNEWEPNKSNLKWLRTPKAQCLSSIDIEFE